MLLEPFTLRVLKAQLNLLLGPIEINQGKVILSDQVAQSIGALFLGGGPCMRDAARGEFVQRIAVAALAFVDGTNVAITG